MQAREADRVVAFHYVEHGRAHLRDGGAAIRLDAGELAVVLGGGAHRLGDGTATPARPLADLLAGAHPLGRSEPPEPPDGGDASRVLCGVLVLDRLDLVPLGRHLPGRLHHRPGPDGGLAALAQRLAAESTDRRPGGGYVVARLAELLLAEALRTCARRDPDAAWLPSLEDPVVWSAVRAVQADPGAPWTLDRLARRAAISPARLAVRFRLALDRSPMDYVTAWRMALAEDLLQNTASSVETIARSVGYANQPAFSRAFRRRYGVPPTVWREQLPRSERHVPRADRPFSPSRRPA